MEKSVLIANLKCSSVCNHLDNKERKDYMIETCVDNNKRELEILENSLLIDLLENEKLLNYIDEYGKYIENCNFNKIKELR